MIFDRTSPGPATVSATTSTATLSPHRTAAPRRATRSRRLGSDALTRPRGRAHALVSFRPRLGGRSPHPHWLGLRVIEGGRRRTDVVKLLPASRRVACLLADHPGIWLYPCRVADHGPEDRVARLTVLPRDAVGLSRAPAAASRSRRDAARYPDTAKLPAAPSGICNFPPRPR